MGRSADIYTRLILDAKEFTQGLDKAKRDTLGFGKNLTTAGKGVEALKGLIGKLGVAVGVAGGAYEAINRTIASNHTLTNDFKGVMEGAKISVDAFFNSVVSGDWSEFIDAMTTSIAKGRELIEVLDQFKNFKVGFDVINSKAQFDLEKAKSVIDDPNSTEEEKKKAQIDYRKRIEELKRYATELDNKARHSARLMLERKGQANGITDDDVEQLLTETITGFDKDYAAYEAKVKELKSKIAVGRGLWSDIFVALGNDATAVSKNIKAREELKAYQEANPELTRRYNIRENLDVEALQEVASLYKEGIEAQKIAYHYQKETFEADRKVQSNAGTKVLSSGATVRETKNELEQITERIKEVTKELSFPTDTSDLLALRSLLEELNDRKKELENQIKLRVDGKEVERISRTGLDLPLTPIMATIKLKEIEGQLLREIETLQEKLKITIDVDIREQLSSEINKKESKVKMLQETALREFKAGGLDLPSADGYLERVEKIKTINTSLSDSFNSITSVMSIMTQGFEDSTAGVLQWAVSVVGAVQQAVTAILPLIATKKAEATANAEAATTGVAASVASIPFAGPAMAISAVLGLIAVLANTPKFEKGGIVGGNSYYGDKILARVNSGELILNREQQSTIYNQLAGAVVQDGDGSSVEFKIRGQELVGILNKHERRISRS